MIFTKDDYNGEAEFVVPDGVIKIGDSAFYKCKNLVSITVPDGVTRIDSGAFYKCKNLVSVTLPDGLTYISDHAFFGCTSLTKINLPLWMNTIGDRAFDGCPDHIQEKMNPTIDGSQLIKPKSFKELQVAYEVWRERNEK